MPNVITIFVTIIEIGHFHFFRIWRSAKPQPIKEVILQSLGLDLVNINVYTKVYQNIPLSSRNMAIFTFSDLALRKASTDDECHFAIPWARSFQHQIVCKMLSKYSKRFKFDCFQNLNLGQTSTHPKCHLTISCYTSCQYQCVCKLPL